MEFPADLKYTESDEWIRLEGSTATLGISDYAQDALSDIVFFEALVAEGDELAKGDAIGAVESVKAAADVYAPAAGKVVAINEQLADTPELVNSDPFGAAWMVKLELSDPAELDSLMDAKTYQAYCQEREH